MENFQSVKSNFENDGTIQIEIKDNIISLEDLKELESLSNNLPLEHIEIGDADEPNLLEVGRFLVDKSLPELVNRPISDRAFEIVTQPSLLEFFKKLLNQEELYVRRMQINIISEGGFVGHHLDTDSNPDYLVAVVFQFGDNFQGGDYVVYGGEKPPRRFKPTRYSMIVSDCKFPHEVEKVLGGQRKSLVFFLSNQNSANTRKAS